MKPDTVKINKSVTVSSPCIEGGPQYNYLFHFKKIKLTRSLDFIIISLKTSSLLKSLLLDEIHSRCIFTQHHITPKCDVDIFYSIFNNKVYIIRHILFRQYRHSWVRIEDPDIGILQDFSRILSSSKYIINQVEFTLDFSGISIHRIYSFLKQHYYLLHSTRSKQFVHNYPDTEYSNDLRKTQSKGLRLYKKKDVTKKLKYARLELLYKKQKLKQLGIKTISDVFGITCDTVLKPLKFKKFNYDRFIKNYVNRMIKGEPQCQLDISEVLFNINKLIKSKSVVAADTHAKGFIPYSCFEIHRFETELKTRLHVIPFLQGDVTEFDSSYFYNDTI